MNAHDPKLETDSHRKPIASGSRSHPVRTGVGAVSGVVAGAVIDTVVGGPVGAVAGGALSSANYPDSRSAWAQAKAAKNAWHRVESDGPVDARGRH